MRALPRVPVILGALGLVAAAGACEQGLLVPPAQEVGSVQMAFDLAEAAAAGFVVDQAVITFVRPDGGDPQLVDAPVVEGSALVEVPLKPGRWDITVELFEGGDVVGTGAGSALVHPGFVTEVDIQIELATGAVQLTVHWGQGFTGVVADLTERPVVAEIGPFGTYTVHGLSRLGWDIEVIESPTQSGLSHKDPGAVSYPDIVMLGLTASLEEVESLAAWVANPGNPQSMAIDLRGLGGEYARIAVYDVVPVDGDVEIVPSANPGWYTLGGIRVRISTARLEVTPGATLIELIDHLAVDPLPACAAPGRLVELEGVTTAFGPCYPEGVLVDPVPGTSDPLHLPALRDAQSISAWAKATLVEVQTAGCVGCASTSRRTGSILTMNAAGLETSRVNLYEIWPYAMTFFDPEVEYGHAYLLSVDIATDRIEEGL